jgi:hypothetical protein
LDVDATAVTATRLVNNRTAPAPITSAVADNPCDREVRFPESAFPERILDPQQVQFPLQVRHFRHSRLSVSPPFLKDPG